jgi:hypothetical protein
MHPLFTLKVPLIGAVFADKVLEPLWRFVGTGDTVFCSVNKYVYSASVKSRAIGTSLDLDMTPFRGMAAPPANGLGQ